VPRAPRAAGALAPAPAAWLEALRRDAWEAFRAAPAPPKTSEAWRRTSFEAFGLDRFEPEAQERVTVPELPPASLEGLSGLLRLDGGSAAFQAAPDACGLVLMDLEGAASSRPELLRPHLESALSGGADPDTRKLELANLAGLLNGAFILVPKGLRLERPVRVVFDHSAGPFAFPRLVALVEEDAELTLVEEHRSSEGADHSVVGVSTVILGAGARARVVYQQESAPGARHFWRQRCVLGPGAALTHVSLVVGSRVHKAALEVELAGRGASSELFAIGLGRGDQHSDVWTKQWHRAPRTSSDLLARSALRGASRSVYTGLIRIEKEAREAEAFQANHNLLLSGKARADSTPVLEILTDEVRCKHASTAGPLGKDELFYLETRGFPREEAERTLVMGFFEPVLKRLPLEAERGRLASLIEASLGEGR